MSNPSTPANGNDLLPPPLVDPPPPPRAGSRKKSRGRSSSRTTPPLTRLRSQPRAEGDRVVPPGDDVPPGDRSVDNPAGGGAVDTGAAGATLAGGGGAEGGNASSDAPAAGGATVAAGGAATVVPPVNPVVQTPGQAAPTPAATGNLAGARDAPDDSALAGVTSAQLAAMVAMLAALANKKEAPAAPAAIDVDLAPPVAMDEDLGTFSDTLETLDASRKTPPGEFRGQMLQRLTAMFTNYNPLVGWRLGGGYSLSNSFDEVLLILRNPSLSPEDTRAKLLPWWHSYRRVLAMLVAEGILAMALFEVLQGIQPAERWEAGNGLPCALALDAIGRLEWVLRMAPRMLRAEIDKATFPVSIPPLFEGHGHAVFINRDLGLHVYQSSTRPRSSEREPHESRYCSPVALRPHFMLFGQILFALHELPPEIYADLRTLIVEGDKLQRWGTSLRWRREVILTGPSNAQRLAAVVVVDTFTRNPQRPAQHPPNLDQDVMAEFAAIYMIVHRRSTANLRQYLIMGKDCRHMSDIRGVSGLYEATARASSYVTMALAQYMPAQHAVAAGWTLEEVAGEELTECDYRNLTLAPPGPTAAGLRAIPAAPLAFSSLGSVHPDESASSVNHGQGRAPRTTTGGRGSTVVGPRPAPDNRVWRVGQPCPALVAGEHPQGGGHLSVRGVCGRCCKTGHRMGSCSSPHRDFNPAQPFNLLREMARGERLVGGDPAQLADVLDATATDLKDRELLLPTPT